MSLFANKTKIVSCHKADSKPVKQEVIGTVILPLLVFPATSIKNVTLTPLNGVYVKILTHCHISATHMSHLQEGFY